MATLFTVGYEATTIDAFVATLRHLRIQALLDIRAVPISRKKGFSKSRLAQALSEANIEYLHFRELGNPKPGRDAARRGDHGAFHRIFGAHLVTDEAQEALDAVARIAIGCRTCLLCFEKDHSECHRSIVADAVAARGKLKVRHAHVREFAMAE